MSNPIVLENSIVQGRAPKSYWDVPHTRQIEGFATDMSVDVGETVDFKINVNGGAGSDYQVEIFRLGYYGGDGARKVAEWVNTDATVQPDPQYDATRGLVDAGNWSVTDSWGVPTDMVSGVFLARLQRLDGNGQPIDGAVNQIPFIVRDDGRPSDIVFQTSDTTWHAYNGWFGNNGELGANFYGDFSGTIDHPDAPDPGNAPQDRAYAVSYNRPFVTRGIEGDQGGPVAGEQDYLFGAEYAAIHWLEQNGYDVSYISGVDTDRLGPNALLDHKAFLSVGHDEYWSGQQRGNVEAARDAGVNLLFWSGNEIYWKTRWETSIVDGVEYRTLVSYKETWAHGDPYAGPDDYFDLDPTNIWTGTWRDMRFRDNPAASGGDETLISGQVSFCNCAENALTGQLFGPDHSNEFGALDVPSEFAPLRVWRDTSIANGGALDIAPGILGYEWNTAPDDENRPAGLVSLSETTIPWNQILLDQGNETGPGIATHNLTLYRAESGALVFGSGTVFWSWMLSNEHDDEPYWANIENSDLQQFTVNMFADMGIQPAVADAILASQGLVRAAASADTAPATAAFTTLPTATTAYSAVEITGTATDDDGNGATADGNVALVEVSVDGGATWRPAEGRENWSYTWLVTEPGTYDVAVRAIDDTLNLPDQGSLETVSVSVGDPVPPASLSLFDPFEPYDGRGFQSFGTLELGTSFVAAETGLVTELKYYRGRSDAADTDVRTGRLWNADGAVLGEVTFTSGPNDIGWQTATLATPVAINAGSEYVVSYTTQDNYVGTPGFFETDFVDPFGILAAPAVNGGVYAGGGGFPNASFDATNYWVDLTFAPETIGNAPPVFTSGPAFSTPENRTVVGAVAASDPNADPLTFAIAGGADAPRFAIGAGTGALSFLAPPDFEAPTDADGDNVYEVLVSVADPFNPPVQQAISVTVEDVAVETGGTVSTLFSPAEIPDTVVTTDPTDYELGVRFAAAGAGEIEALRYYRGTADAGDTDARTLNLWSGTGTLLASASVTSAPGETGWQQAALATPVAVQPGATYVASYGTTQNYAFTSNFFTADHTGADGVLSAPAAGGNGVFAGGGTGVFPTNTWNSSNYWVDVLFEGGTLVNTPPAFTSPDAFTVTENRFLAGTLAATDPEGNALTFAIAGGADAARFAVDAATGALSFLSRPDFEAPADADGNNVYELLVSVSDPFAAPVEQAITVTVADDPNEPSTVASSLFGLEDVPAVPITYDPTTYELGVRFEAAEAGAVSSLMYWRAAEDAGDTDTRTLNLWSPTGEVLGSVTVVSGPGETGWQIGALDRPIDIAANATYVASYGTTENYVANSGYFDVAQLAPDGALSAPAGVNGVFAAGSTGAFPTETWNASNYWVDLLFEPGVITNAPPAFTSPDAFEIVENGRAVTTLAATDADGDALTFAIAGGADAGRFTVDGATGALSFVLPPDFEAPADADGDNVYELAVSVSDGRAAAVQQAITVTVLDEANETGSSVSTLFGLASAPATTITTDPTWYELGVKFRAAEPGTVTGLTYYRGAEDADDTDVRTLNLWTEDGQLIGSADATAGPGEAGWQVAPLASPVDIAADTLYVASYGTTENYVASGSFFGSDHTGPDGTLTAPSSATAGGNGVFAHSTPGAFPTATWNDSNYWVDVLFEPAPLV